MVQPEMILETVEIVEAAIEKGEPANLIINNRAGGNAPLIADAIAGKFMGKKEPKRSENNMNLWDI